MAKMLSVFVSGSYCFLPHPCGVRTHWMRTDRCVAFVGCEYCGAKRGEFCEGVMGKTASVHTKRRDEYRRRKNELDPDREVERIFVTIEERHRFRRDPKLSEQKDSGNG